MIIDILTLFPDMFKGPFDYSIVKRAQENKLVSINIHNLRQWSKDKYQTVDGKPYGGGTGMILRVDIVASALSSLKSKKPSAINHQALTILLTPQGQTYNQQKAQQLSKCEQLTFICGHYEGYDERIRKLVDEEISIGDYILTGGELPAMVLVDSLVRLIPGVLKKEEATQSESFSLNTKYSILNTKLLEYPQYTQPQDYKGLKVPDVLLSGNHQEIAKWRSQQAILRTKKRRPDLLKNN